MMDDDSIIIDNDAFGPQIEFVSVPPVGDDLLLISQELAINTCSASTVDPTPFIIIQQPMADSNLVIRTNEAFTNEKQPEILIDARLDEKTASSSICIDEQMHAISETRESTDNRDKGESSKVQCRAPEETPLPFRRALFWPEDVQKGKRKRVEKVPTVATSDEWQQFHKSKEEEKLSKVQVKEEKQKQKKELQKEKKRLQEEIKTND